LNQLKKISDFGKYLHSLVLKEINNEDTELLHTEINRARHYNHWHSEFFATQRLLTISQFLSANTFIEFFKPFENLSNKPHFIGISSDENIPLEEFSVLLTILISGNSFQYKTSDKSDKLVSLVFEMLSKHIPKYKERIKFSDATLRNVDALYFTQREKGNVVVEKYLKIKKSVLEFRSQSVSILKGDESNDEIALMGNDIFNYFGQGTGNIRKIYVPEGFDITRIYENIEQFNTVMEHSPYANNYQYHQSVYLMNRIKHLDNGFILFKEDPELRAPTGVMYYQFYENYKSLHSDLTNNSMVSNIYVKSPKGYKDKVFGESIKQLLLPSFQLINILK